MRKPQEQILGSSRLGWKWPKAISVAIINAKLRNVNREGRMNREAKKIGDNIMEYTIKVSDRIVPFLKRLADGHGVSIEQWIAAWLEASAFQAAAMTDEEGMAALAKPATQAGMRQLDKRIKEAHDDFARG